MKSRVLAVLLVISLGINIGFLLHWLWPRIAPRQTDGASSGWHAGPIKRHLGLNSRQARQMEGERRQVLAQARPLQDELRLKRRELFLLMKSKDVGEKELDAVLNEISRLQAAIEKIFVRHSLEVKGLFSPAQLRKYEHFLERGLCPGMMTAASCPPGQLAADRDCQDDEKNEQTDQKGKLIKEVLPDDKQKDF